MAQLIGFVSDERYVALADVSIEFQAIDDSGHLHLEKSWIATSRASGSVFCDLPPGRYRAIFQKPGFGSKFSTIEVPCKVRTSFVCYPMD